MADLLAAALEYAAAGIHVFPARVSIVGGHKEVVPVAEWRKASTTNAAEIRGWFAPGQKWATASLCIDCGKSGLVVIDPDEGEGRNGLANWAALRAEYDIPIAPHAHTPGGGEHWYYREHPRRVVGIDSTGKVAKDVDVRGLGGFVLAWPSEDTRGSYGQIGLAELANAPMVPDVVIERMTAKATATTVPTTVPGTVPPAQDDFWRSMAPPRTFTQAQAKEFCVPPLEAFRAMRTPEDRGFNQRLNEVACVWSHFVPAFMTAEQAETEIYKAALANRSVEYQGEAAVRATIRSGLNQQRDPWRAERVDETAETEADAEPETRIVDLGPFLDGTYVPPVPSVGAERDDNKYLLYPSRWHTVVGLTAAGKSWLALWHAKRAMEAGGTVVYLHFEEALPVGTLARLRKMGCDPQLIRDRFIWLDCSRRWSFGDLSPLLGKLDQSTLVILDGINAACSSHGWPVDKPEAIGAYRAMFVTPATSRGAAVLSLGHPPKGRDRQGERHGFGSTAWLDEVDGVAFRLEASKTPIGRGRLGRSSLYSVKDRYGEVEAAGLAEEKREAGWYYQGSLEVDDTVPSGTTVIRLSTPSVNVERATDEIDALAAAIVACLSQVDGGTYPSERWLRDELRAEGIGFRNGAPGEALARLERKGKIVRSPFVRDNAPRSGRLCDPQGDLDDVDD